jgi:hypothetical protein
MRRDGSSTTVAGRLRRPATLSRRSPTELYVVANTADITSLRRDAHAIATIGIDGVTVSAAERRCPQKQDNAAAALVCGCARSRGLTAELLVSN